MTNFSKPGKLGIDYPQMVKAAGLAALADAGVTFKEVEQVGLGNTQPVAETASEPCAVPMTAAQVVAGYVYGESCSGTRAVYELGMSGKPIFNVNSNCSTGSSALLLTRQCIAGGLAECAMAVGFEKMQAGSLSFGNADREGPIDHFMSSMTALRGAGPEKVPPAPWLFGNAGRYHMEVRASLSSPPR
jgi:acetyl-CoA acyltransferase